MALWKERQIQVKKEELRIKESLSKFKASPSKASEKDRELQQKVFKAA